MKIKNKHSKMLEINLVVFAILGLLVVSSCTKSIPYETLPGDAKEKDVSKSLLDTESEYLYSSSQQNASKSAADAFPFSAGDNKRVKLEITKNSLRVIEVERDQRFASNTLNNKLVIEIPVEHVQYDCKKDRFGECTNSEEETSNVPWEQRDTLRVKLEDVKAAELELLPILSSSTFGENCYENVSSRLIQSQIEKDAINFQIERTFKTRLNCLSNDATLSDATISAIYHYSLVKLSSVLSKDYKPVSYPESSDDEQTFGFFSTKRNKLDVDNNSTDKSTIQIMNRWNPNRKEIVYYLSDEFAKPENKLIKKLTEQTVASLNKGLDDAGVNFKINLKDPAGKIPGDIRNSMIVLVEDPVASSVIGYGPQTEDPVTGEIISARTVMFLGTIKSFIKYTYDDILRAKQHDIRESQKLNSKFTLSTQISERVDYLKKSGKVFGATGLMQQVLAQLNDKKVTETQENIKQKEKPSDSLQLKAGELNIKKAVASLKNYTAQKNEVYSGKDLKSKIKYLQEAKNCAFAPAAEGVASGISRKLLAKFSDDMKPWAQLSDSEKESAIEIILPEIWIPTLIHELGHNLGLRHNFAASEDKANFLSDEELLKSGIEHKIPFSSVMDYGNDLKTLPVLGKYDIAALQFGYLRKVTVNTGTEEQLVDIPTTLEALKPQLEKEAKVLKSFQYCTDEHTGINAGCKRFDLGTTYTEIVQNLISEYEEAYSTRNFRNGRAHFSQMDDLAYLSRISGLFRELRIMMEVRERIKYRYSLSDDAKEWETVGFLKDLKQATLLGGSFMANVLLTPDLQCAVAMTSNLNKIIAVIPAQQLNPDALSCAEVQLRPEYTIVGQAGKSFNSKKDPNSRNSYADQIDVRGIWLDKVAAIRTLTARSIDVSTMNNYTDNFLNIPELRTGILGVAQGLITNNVVNTLDFKMNDGSVAQFEISYDMNESQVIGRPMLLDAVERSAMNEESKQRYVNLFGVNRDGTTPLKKIIARTMSNNAQDPNRLHTSDLSIRDALSVYKYNSVVDSKLSKTTRSITIDGIDYVADVNNTTAREAIELLPLVTLMDQLDLKKLEIVMQLKLKKQTLPPPADQSQEAKVEHALMKDIYNKVSVERMNDYLAGVIKDQKFYTELLQSLPIAN